MVGFCRVHTTTLIVSQAPELSFDTEIVPVVVSFVSPRVMLLPSALAVKTVAPCFPILV